LAGRILSTGKPKNLLWSFLFLKTYPTEHVLAAMTQSDEKTARKWIWEMLEQIALIPMVR